MRSYTPAISVLSAVEGLELLDPTFSRAVIPVTLAVIVGLFWIQRNGTAKVGRAFGPIMVVWFVALAVSGAVSIISAPVVLKAINPLYAVKVLLNSPGTALALIAPHFWRSPVARRYMQTWAISASSRYGWPGSPCVARAAAELHGAGGAAPARRWRRPCHVRPGAADPAAVDGGAGDRGLGDRLAGGYLGGFLRNPSGHPARPAAAHAHPADLSLRAGTDLCARRSTGCC